MTNNIEIAQYAVDEARKNGASEADAILVEAADTSFRTRLRNFENVERSESRDLGVRVFLKEGSGYKTAVISTNNLQKSNVTETVKRAIDIAKMAPADEFMRLAEKGEYTSEIANLKTFDTNEASTEELKNWAFEAEDAALSVNGITNSEGADASFSTSDTVLVTSKGFSGSYKHSGFNVSVSVIAGADMAMETDYEYCYSRFKQDMIPAREVGKKAAELTVKKLNPRKVKSCKAPIIFDRRVSKGLVSSFCSAINGSGIVKKSSFLSDKLEQRILPEFISIYDDPTLEKGLSTEPFDAEGIRGEKMVLVENGVLKNWILDIRSATKLGLKTNGRASRGISSNPSPYSTNVYMTAGKISAADMVKDIKEGLYLTDVFGMGVNNVTGDYSQGASGFWIENGEIAYPVSEITIAGNLLDMFKSLTPANDLEMRYSKNAPTLRIDGMTIAGS
jgi:PmbA protein